MRFNPGGGANINKMMKEAKKIQARIAEMQQELENREFEASSGGGAVVAKVSGKQQLVSLKILPEAVDVDDIEMLEDMILAAVNEAIKVSQETVSQEMAKITGGLNIPGI
ncbi:MAG: YbaB/EbfC family nucleoid-associated protein [Syntrophomonadaceae bacterium]|jgi:DNA-binding YbaB/EbfC family protein|nr:YbaB/EbfC family nucleoid-associated protein [Syntrophomonadaceae bacterium]